MVLHVRFDSLYISLRWHRRRDSNKESKYKLVSRIVISVKKKRFYQPLDFPLCKAQTGRTIDHNRNLFRKNWTVSMRSTDHI